MFDIIEQTQVAKVIKTNSLTVCLQMDESFNLTLTIIVNEPIELSDLFYRAKRSGDVNLRFPVPETRLLGGAGLTVAFGGNSNFTFRGIVAGKDLSLFNMNYGNVTRGVFQVQILNTKDVGIGNEAFDALRRFVNQLAYTDIFAYEIVINLSVNHIDYPPYDKIKTLKTMKSPKLKAIKLLDGDTGTKDLREEYISEISMERIASQPNKSIITTVYRTKEFQTNALRDVLSDIDEVIKLVR